MTAKLYSPEDAPEVARDTLSGIEKRMNGFLPNLYRQMAATPPVLDAYLQLTGLLAKTSFTPAEQQLIFLTASARNGCVYCVAAHSSGARMAKLDKDVINAIRDGEAIPDARLQALRTFVETAMETRGKVGADAMQAFLDAGFTQDHAMEALIGIATKALSNSFARMFDTPLDDVLSKMAWDGNENV